MRFVLLFCAVLGTPGIASAEERAADAVPPPVEARDTEREFGGWDWLAGPPASLVGSLVGALPGVGIFWAIEQADRPLLGLRIANSLVLITGFYWGAGAGPWAYGKLRGYNGRIGAGVGGALVGALTLSLPLLVFQHDPEPPAWPGILAAVGIYGGATLGYAVSTRYAPRGMLTPLISATPESNLVVGLQWTTLTF